MTAMTDWIEFTDQPETVTRGPDRNFVLDPRGSTTGPLCLEVEQAPEPWANPEPEWEVRCPNPIQGELDRLKNELFLAHLVLERYQRRPGVREVVEFGETWPLEP